MAKLKDNFDFYHQRYYIWYFYNFNEFIAVISVFTPYYLHIDFDN